MRENTRCEVDEPISTPTLRTTSSSSSTSERPELEKKMRPPCASSSAIVPATPNPSPPREGRRSSRRLRQGANHAPANFRTTVPFLYKSGSIRLGTPSALLLAWYSALLKG